MYLRLIFYIFMTVLMAIVAIAVRDGHGHENEYYKHSGNITNIIAMTRCVVRLEEGTFVYSRDMDEDHKVDLCTKALISHDLFHTRNYYPDVTTGECLCEPTN